jgi:tetratricopeptide (TPR) repeat protein
MGFGNYQEMIQCCDKAIAINPKTFSAWLNKGAALNELKLYREAIQCFATATKLEPKSTSPMRTSDFMSLNGRKSKSKKEPKRVGRIGDERAVEPLTKALYDTEFRVRVGVRAEQALDQIRSRTAHVKRKPRREKRRRRL